MRRIQPPFVIVSVGGEWTASGSLESSAATVSGAATKIALASGSLSSAVATVSGTATQTANASGYT